MEIELGTMFRAIRVIVIASLLLIVTIKANKTNGLSEEQERIKKEIKKDIRKNGKKYCINNKNLRAKRKGILALLLAIWIPWIIFVASAAIGNYVVAESIENLIDDIAKDIEMMVAYFVSLMLIIPYYIAKMCRFVWRVLVPIGTIILLIATICIIINDIVRKKRNKNGMLLQDGSGNIDLSNDEI